MGVRDPKLLTRTQVLAALAVACEPLGILDWCRSLPPVEDQSEQASMARRDALLYLLAQETATRPRLVEVADTPLHGARGPRGHRFEHRVLGSGYRQPDLSAEEALAGPLPRVRQLRPASAADCARVATAVNLLETLLDPDGGAA
jgi:hypothetical protein